MSDPKRLLDATSGSSTVRALLEAAQVSTPNFEPPAGMAEAQWNALEAKLAANAGSTTGAPQSSRLRHLPKLGGAVITSALILGGIFALQQTSPDTSGKPSQGLPAVALQTVASVATPIAVAPAHDARGIDPDSLPVASVTAIVRATSKSTALPSASVFAESPGADLEEAASVRDARRALRQGNANEALSILASYDKSHRTGMLLQERSFLRIEALSLKADVRAETEAAAFLKAFPNSPYADRVRAMKH
jgi:hypothetical protein